MTNSGRGSLVVGFAGDSTAGVESDELEAERRDGFIVREDRVWKRTTAHHPFTLFATQADNVRPGVCMNFGIPAAVLWVVLSFSFFLLLTLYLD